MARPVGNHDQGGATAHLTGRRAGTHCTSSSRLPPLERTHFKPAQALLFFLAPKVELPDLPSHRIHSSIWTSPSPADSMRLDSDENHDREDEDTQRQNRSAITPLSTHFGQGVAADSWTGGLPADTMKPAAQKTSRKPKPSYFEAQADPGSANMPEEDSDPWVDTQEPISNAEKKDPADVVKTTHSSQPTFSDPKHAPPSPTPRPRATRSQNAKQSDSSTTGHPKTSKKTLPPNSPTSKKIARAMRGASALAPPQENPAKGAAKRKPARKASASTRPKVPALEVEDASEADNNYDSADVFDTANVPLSDHGSPFPAQKSSKVPPKQPTSRAKKHASQPKKETTNSESRVKISPLVQLAKINKAGTTVLQTDNSVADDQFEDETQGARRRNKRAKASVSEAEKEPITIIDETSPDDGDGDYMEQGRRQQPRKGTRKHQKEVSPDQVPISEPTPAPRKPTIIPFDKTGPKTNGLSRAKATSKGAHSMDQTTTAGASGVKDGAVQSLDPPAALQTAHGHDTKGSRKTQEDDSALQRFSTANIKRHRPAKEVRLLVSNANGNGVMHEYPGTDTAPPSDNQSDVMVFDDGISIDDDGLGPPPKGVVADVPAGRHVDRDRSSHEGGQRIIPHMQQQLDNSMQLDSVIQVKPGLNRSLPSNEYGYSLPLMNHRTHSDPSIRAVQSLPRQTIPQIADVTMNRPAKRQRQDQTTAGTALESLVPRSGQHDGVVSEKPSSRGASGTRRQREPEVSNNPEHPTSIQSDTPDPMMTSGTKFSKVPQHDFSKGQSNFKPMPQRDIAQQFLSDMTSRSFMLGQEAASEPAQEESVADALDDTTWDDDHAGHQKRELAQRLSDRERVFEEAPATPGQALGEAMHRIVGVCPTLLHIPLQNLEADRL